MTYFKLVWRAIAAATLILVLFSAPAFALDFGNDSSRWANDGECDDPRFVGPGVAAMPLESERMRDATDCQNLLSAGQISLIGTEKSGGGKDTGADIAVVSTDGSIDFGDDASAWANDGECDDPRFIGPGVAVELLEEDRGRDATDCRMLFEAGEISIAQPPSARVGAIDFGDDSGQWSNDGECDDPRFDGDGAADVLLGEDMSHDATDCRALFLAGQVEYLGDDPSMEVIYYDDIEFGDNTSRWAYDQECDDMRFSGANMGELIPEHRTHDATDCLELYQSGDIRFGGSSSPGPVNLVGFGDDTSRWANDGECDDPRFEGLGAASILLDEDLGHDATDCSALVNSGQITWIDGAPTPTVDGNFGDDSSEWSNDGECDDPRFTGTGMAAASSLTNDNIGRDATDCSDLLAAGQVYWAGANNQTSSAIDFGDDSSTWANDNECDDPRFAGSGVAAVLLDEDLGRDATDCRNLFNSGDIYLIDGGTGSTSNADLGDDSSEWANDGECDDPRFTGSGMAVASSLTNDNIGRDATDCGALLNSGGVQWASTSASIDFGNDSSIWANDGECDDPRFGGPGTANTLLDDDLGRDATDCRTLLETGEVFLLESTEGPVSAVDDIDFGDDLGRWANDGECDDPRFRGQGMAVKLVVEDLGHDRTDCLTLYDAGAIHFVGLGTTSQPDVSNIDFGDDTSQWSKDGECDDPRFVGPGMASSLSDENIRHDAIDCRTFYENGQIALI